jgi:hypothetical protein
MFLEGQNIHMKMFFPLDISLTTICLQEHYKGPSPIKTRIELGCDKRCSPKNFVGAPTLATHKNDF